MKLKDEYEIRITVNGYSVIAIIEIFILFLLLGTTAFSQKNFLPKKTYRDDTIATEIVTAACKSCKTKEVKGFVIIRMYYDDRNNPKVIRYLLANEKLFKKKQIINGLPKRRKNSFGLR